MASTSVSQPLPTLPPTSSSPPTGTLGNVAQMASQFNQFGPTPAPAPIVHTEVQQLPSAPPQQQRTPVTLELRANQVDHFLRITKNILPNFYFYMDGSEMGTGKTPVGLAAAITTGLPILVFCPLGARKTWIRETLKYSVSCYNLPETGGIMTYDCLRSRKGYQPAHGLLHRVDTANGVEFQPTALLVQLLHAGVFIFFDECQKLKNNSDQNKAAKAIIRALYQVGGRSRVGLL